MNSVRRLVDEETLVKRVLQLQVRDRRTDQQMADSIGCSRPTYQQVRTGKMPAGSAFLWGAIQFISPVANGNRSSVVRRETKETDINLELDIDGSGRWEITTGISMFDHMLSQLAQHGLFDIKLAAKGDDQHHLVEDVAICLGKALSEALGEKRGIVRMANVAVPMDDALATAIVDISGRGYSVLELTFAENDMFGFPTDLVRHFLESFAVEARLNLHIRVVYGNNDHHKAEAIFKALGRALDAATRIDERLSGELPSTKEFLEG